MTSGAPASTCRRIRSVTGAGLVAVIAATATVIGFQMLAHSFSTTSPPPTAVSLIDAIRSDARGAPGAADRAAPDGAMDLDLDQLGALGEADGYVPDGATVFDDEYPAVANLDRGLRGALREAARHAAVDGIEFYVNSGWRSPEYQERLLREATLEYGSEDEAARWVGTVETSAHVSGNAVDIGSSDATAWLSDHGTAYGLCQIYVNEPWHYELRPEASDHGCPPMYADPTHDPRMWH